MEAWGKQMNTKESEVFTMYEFVSKKEYGPIRKEIEDIIKKAQIILREEDSDLTFQFKLVGSGQKHLITRIEGGNEGYDFDYNLSLNNKFNWKPSVRKVFFEAFQRAIVNTRFNKIEDSTSVITIKQVSKKNSKVIVGCDFSIVFYPKDESGYYNYSRFNKNINNYTWEIRNVSRFSEQKLEWLRANYKNIWNIIKDEYLKLKDNDKQHKHSFILYHEAINNIYNQYNPENQKKNTSIEKIQQNFLLRSSYSGRE